MVDVLAVIGEAHTHKTSSIRALTGVRQIEPAWNVSYIAHGDGVTYVHPPGLQEIDVSPEAFIRKVNKKVKAAGVRYVIVALRNRGVRGHPDAAGYLDAFQNANWNVAGPAFLSAAASPGGFSIPEAGKLPSNEVAARLRKKWGIK